MNVVAKENEILKKYLGLLFFPFEVIHSLRCAQLMFSSFPPGPRDSPSFTDAFEYES